MVRLDKGGEVEPGAGEEPPEQAGLVLHPLEPGLHQRGQLDTLRGLMPAPGLAAYPVPPSWLAQGENR